MGFTVSDEVEVRRGSMANALLDVLDTFLSLDKQYTVLRLACRTQADLDALDAEYVAAQKNFDDATDEELEDDDAAVAVLSQELKDCNAEVKQAETEMGNMSKVLDNLTEAVTIGSKLVAMIP